MKKRILSMLMALCLCLGLLPGTAFANNISGKITGNISLDGSQDSITGSVQIINGSEESPTTITVTGTVLVKGAIAVATGSYVKFTGSGTLKRDSSFTDGAILTVNSGATVTLDGITLDGGSYDAQTSALVVDGTVNMTSGAIKNNINASDLTFDEKNGGGVRVNDGGVFNMSSGAISGNNAAGGSGGGVRVVKSGVFNMSGGSITGNNSYSGGAGVYIKELSGGGTFNMSGGSITGNATTGGGYGGGVYVDNNTTFSLSGSASVTGNKENSDSDSNVYLGGGTIHISSVLTGAVGIRPSQTSGAVLIATGDGATSESIGAGRLYNDSDGRALTATAEGIYFGIPTVSAAISSAKVSGTAGTAITEQTATITLTNTTFKALSANADVSTWFTNMPAGLTAKIAAAVGAGGSSVTITFAGTPTAASSAAMSITIPMGSLNRDADLAVTANVNAKWVITEAVTPTIAFTTQPASSTTVTAGSISGSLTAAAVTPSGTATLNWYACDADGDISGSSLATGDSFTIPTTLTAGTYYYVCQATYTDATAVKSSVATVTVQAVSTTTYDLWVGGVRVTSDNASGVTGTGITGTVTYTPANGETPAKLTLNGAAISGAVVDIDQYNTGNGYGIYAGSDLDIVVTADSTVTGADVTASSKCSYGVYAKGKLTLSGGGTLTATGGTAGTDGLSAGVSCGVLTSNGKLHASGQNSGVYCGSALNVSGGTLTATGGKTGVSCGTASITLSGGALNATGTQYYGVDCGSTFTINGGTLTATGGMQALNNQTPTAGTGVALTIAAGGSSGSATDTTYTNQKYVNITVTKQAQSPLTYTGGTTVTYGQQLILAASGGSGSGAVSFNVTNGTGAATISGSTLTATKAGTVTVTATKAGDDTYASVTSNPVEITIEKATPTVTPSYTPITEAGKTLADAKLTCSSYPEGTIAWVDAQNNKLPDETVVTANTSYRWLFTPDPNDTNFNTLTGSIVVYPVVTHSLPDQYINIPYNTADSTIYRIELPTIAASLGTVAGYDWDGNIVGDGFMHDATNDGLVKHFAKMGTHSAADVGKTDVVDMIVFIETSDGSTIIASLKVIFTLTAPSSGGGGSGGGGTDTTPVVSRPETSGDTTTVTTTVTPSTSGSESSVTVSSTTANNAVNNAIEAAEENNTAPVVEIEVNTPARADSIAVTLPSAALGTLSENGDAQLVITSGVADVTIDADALTAIAEQSGRNLTMSVSPVESSELNSRQQAAIGDAPVYDVTIESGRTVISDLGGGRISVTVPYELTEGQTAAGLTVYYLDDNGNLHPCTTGYNAATGMLTFHTDHLSKYVVMYDETAAWANPFTDVSESDWFYGNVAYAYENGLMTGTSATTFAPHGTTTRAMVATVLWRRSGSPEVEGMYADYADVAQGSWYENAIGWAAKNGILSGYGGGFMGPQDTITREQMAVMLWRYAGSPTATDRELNFSDADAVSGYALEAMRWAVENGIIGGTDLGTLMPKASATRAQVAAMLMRFLQSTGR